MAPSEQPLSITSSSTLNEAFMACMLGVLTESRPGVFKATTQLESWVNELVDSAAR